MVSAEVAVLLACVQYGIAVLCVFEIRAIVRLMRASGVWWLPVVLIVSNVLVCAFSVVTATLTMIAVAIR